MSGLVITSPANPRLKGLAGLRRRRTREESGTTLLEGYEELQLALDAGVVPRALYFCPELMPDAARRGEVVRQAAAGAFNFAFACWIAGIVAWIAVFTVIGIPLALIIGLALVVVTILFPILGAVRANNGEPYRYPFQIPILT